jgi:hypothetical protein
VGVVIDPATQYVLLRISSLPLIEGIARKGLSVLARAVTPSKGMLKVPNILINKKTKHPCTCLRQGIETP